MTKTRFILLAVAVAAIQPSAPAKADEQSDHGRNLFQDNNCYQCHGRVGQGGAGPTIAAPRLMAKPNFMAFVRKPPPSGMPPYTTEVISDADLGSIWEYLNAQPQPPAALPEELQRLKPAKGQ